jgi:peptide/nickel transport system permease protein
MMDYVRAARAKGLSRLRIYLVHVLPNVMTSTLTLGGLVITGLIGGTVVVENVFAWPGLGTAIVQAINERDYPVIQAIVLLLGVIVVVVNAIVDVLIALLDPRSMLRED